MNGTEWGGVGSLPEARDINNPDNAANIAKLTAEKNAKSLQLG